MNFQHLLEQHGLAASLLAVVNNHYGKRGLSLRRGTIIQAPSST